MKNLFFIVGTMLILASCTSNNTGTQESTSPNTKIQLVSIDEFMSSPETWAGKEIQLQGLVTHVCKHGGQKLFISGKESSDALRIDVGENITEFDIALEGTEVIITGIAEVMEVEIVAAAEKKHEDHDDHDCEFENAQEQSESAASAKTIKDYHLIASSYKAL